MKIPRMHSESSVGGVGRPWLERVLDVVRQLGASRDLDETLSRIVEGVVDVLAFDAAAINVRTEDGAALRVAAVAGPPELEQLRGQDSPLGYFVVQNINIALVQWPRVRVRGPACGHASTRPIRRSLPAG